MTISDPSILTNNNEMSTEIERGERRVRRRR